MCANMNSQVSLKEANALYRAGKYAEALLAYTHIKNRFPALAKTFELNMAQAKRHMEKDVDSIAGDVLRALSLGTNSQLIHVNFFNESLLKLSQNCRRIDGWIVSQQSGSTPGLVMQLPGNYGRSVKICLHQLESTTSQMSAFLHDEAGNLVSRSSFKCSSTPQDLEFRLEPKLSAKRLFITFNQPNIGDKFRFRTLSIELQVDSESVSTKLGELASQSLPTIAAGVASVPSREQGLKQAITALMPQVNEIHVFLNGYEDVPAWLLGRSGINIYQSQQFDDLGDAGKFFGFSHTDCEYYLTFDDDIVYPEDYAEKLVAAAKKHNAPVGVHGSLLRYPVSGYYGQSARHVFHFANGNGIDRKVHILGTGTLCVEKKRLPSLPKFYYRNMADIWFAKHCVESNIPQICVSRAENWLRPFGSDEDSIYKKNHQEFSTQKLIVEQLVESMAMKLSSVKGPFTKIAVGIKTFNRLPYLKDCIDSLVKTVCGQFEVVIIVADDGSTDGTVTYLKNLQVPYEFHAIYNNRVYVSGQTNSIIDRAITIGADFIIVADDDLCFKKKGWMTAYFSAAMQSGYHHLCHFNIPHYKQLCERRNESFPPKRHEHSQHPLLAYGPVEKCMGALFTLTPDVVKKVGWADEVNFFVRGMWHVDYSARCCRAGFNEYERFFDIKDANNFLELQNTKSENYETSISWDSEDFKRASTPEERQRRKALVSYPNRIFVSREHAQNGSIVDALALTKRRLVHINDIFERIFVINLDRRPDRMTAIDVRMRQLGIKYERFSAVDGSSLEVREEYEKYKQARAHKSRNKQLSAREFNLEDRPDVQRVNHLEKTLKGPAIRTAGAWAYSKTYQQILTYSLKKGFERILVLDDDGVFHKDFHNIFDRAMTQLPDNWKICQLGTMQYDWELIRPYSEHLYMPDGVVVASHAVGFHMDVASIMLDYIDRWSLPFDIGPLHYACRSFKEQSFIVSPNLIIQDQSESDINSSEVAKVEAAKKFNVYKWEINEYF